MKFFTDTGIEVPAVTTEQTIEVDRVAMEEMGTNLFQMMENAGRNLALQAIIYSHHLTGHQSPIPPSSPPSPPLEGGN